MPGIGEKTAQALLNHFSSLDKVYEELEKVKELELRGAKRVHKLLSEHREQAYLSRQLAKIHCEVSLECSEKSLEWNMPEPEVLKRLFTRLNFGGQLSGRFQRLYEKA